MSAIAAPRASTADSPTHWSLDAWALVRPRRAFAYLGKHPPPPGMSIALRRPVFVSLMFGCVASILASGSLTLRLFPTASLFWTYVPAAQLLALAVTTRRRRLAFSQTIDTFFVGFAPITLFLLGLTGVLSLVPGEHWWGVLTGPALWAWMAMLAWSAWIDLQFFQAGMHMTRVQALRALFLQRLIAWGIIFIVFAVPSPGLLLPELIASIRDLR